ncbi:hypothetical protein [Fusobacterium gastrosuis]|nr:hypothetical protein [Fusobacteriaceae bacterium]MDY5713669.1 hypothetical protein [Fusobacterium gastrosuis]
MKIYVVTVICFISMISMIASFSIWMIKIKGRTKNERSEVQNI